MDEYRAALVAVFDNGGETKGAAFRIHNCSKAGDDAARAHAFENELRASVKPITGEAKNCETERGKSRRIIAAGAGRWIVLSHIGLSCKSVSHARCLATRFKAAY